MYTFDVQDMTCGHCSSTITKAVKALDPSAQVHIDIPSHRVDIDSTAANGMEWLQAIRQAGYTPVAVQAAAPLAAPAAAPARKSGCCCG